MNTIFGFPAGDFEPWLDAFVKGVIWIAGAAVGGWLWGRVSAARRHLVWTCALIGLPGLTLICLVGPSLAVPVPTGEAGMPGLRESHDIRFGSSEAMWSEQANETHGGREGMHSSNSEAISAAGVVDSARPRRTAWIAVVILSGWMVPALLVLSPGWIGVVARARIGRRARRPEDGFWDEPLRKARFALELGRRRVVLLEHPGRIIPMTWGILRPRILLPREARNWDRKDRERVLLHELAHVQRHDCLTRFLGRFGLAFHALNPLAWWAWREMGMESERACDDRVLSAGSDPVDYADQLLQLARNSTGLSRLSSLAMAPARWSRIEGRIRSILDAGRRRGRVRLRDALLALVLTAICVTSISVIRPVAVEAQLTIPAPAKPATQPATSLRHFVRLVVGIDRMTLEGEPVTWEELDSRLAEIPDRGNTVLEIAMDTEDLTVGRWREAKQRAARLSHRHGFEYLSEIGIHPLGSSGSASQPRPMNESQLAALRDQAIIENNLLDALNYEMGRVRVRDANGHAYKDKISLDNVWENFVRQNRPDEKAVQALMQEVQAWALRHREDPEIPWRAAHALAAMAEAANHPKAAIDWMEKAIASYPPIHYTEPSKHSKFQHLVNNLAELIWQSEGYKAAENRALKLFRNDERFEYFFLPWWQDQFRRQELNDAFPPLCTQVEQIYRERTEKFPARRELTRRYLAQLAERTKPPAPNSR